MFKSLTKDLTGTADICSIVSDASKLAVAPYLLPHETVLFAFQSAKDEFVFTNEALVLNRGENATTTRKLVERLEYRDCPVSDVAFETTGRIDRDCEIKFRIGEREVSIDIARKEEGAVKVYYKALVALAREQQQRRRSWRFATDGLGSASTAMRLKGLAVASTSRDGNALTQQADKVLAWMRGDYDQLNSRCYKDVIMRALETK